MSIPVRSAEAAANKYLHNCIRAYFEREPGCGLRLVVGVIDGAKTQARIIMEMRFAQYATAQQYRDLMSLLS